MWIAGENMKQAAIVLTLFVSAPAYAHSTCPAGSNYTLALHGGAGVITKSAMTDEREAAYRKSIKDVLEIGNDMLKNGKGALDVVESIIVLMEDDKKYNAGRGAVFSASGRNELDASIMDGRDRNTGAIAGVTTVKNPIKLARMVMEKSRHVMLQSDGAEKFALENDIEMVDPPYFWTERRWQQMQKKLYKKEGHFTAISETKYGTVGVVVRDGCGDLAAGTSTGGLTAKKWGRVGDTPIIGAGTYADNRFCAVSSTGTGEYFIRATIARDVCARQEFTSETIQESADHMIHNVLTEMGGDGGIITLDDEGNYGFSFNTEGMYRGAVRNGEFEIKIFGTE